jgi:hypothetical protein
MPRGIRRDEAQCKAEKEKEGKRESKKKQELGRSDKRVDVKLLVLRFSLFSISPHVPFSLLTREQPFQKAETLLRASNKMTGLPRSRAAGGREAPAGILSESILIAASNAK